MRWHAKSGKPDWDTAHRVLSQIETNDVAIQISKTTTVAQLVAALDGLADNIAGLVMAKP